MGHKSITHIAGAHKMCLHTRSLNHICSVLCEVSSGATTEISPPPAATFILDFGEEICTGTTAIQSFPHQEGWVKLQQYLFCMFKLSRGPPGARRLSTGFPFHFKEKHKEKGLMSATAVSDILGVGTVTSET